MRILYWSELFWPYVGGPEVFARRLLPALQDRGYKIIVATSHDHLDLPDRSQLDGIPVHRFAMRAALGSGNMERLAEVLHQITQLKREVAPDVIHVSGLGPSAFFHLMTETSHPAPFLVSIRTEVLGSQKGRDGSILEKTLRRADWVTAVSTPVLQQTRQLAPEIADRSSVIYNFIDVPDQPPTSPPLAHPCIVCIGRLISAKGFDLAVKAFASVLALHPQARLVIAGDGPEKLNLELLSQNLRVAHGVQFPGPLAPNDVPDLLKSATLVVVPSRREGLPMVAVEAGIMALPVIATRTGGLPEVILDGVTGVLVPKEDVDALAEAICALLEQPLIAAEMGQRGRDRVRAMFAREHCVEAYSDIYQSLSRKGRLTRGVPSFVRHKENRRGSTSAPLS